MSDEKNFFYNKFVVYEQTKSKNDLLVEATLTDEQITQVENLSSKLTQVSQGATEAGLQSITAACGSAVNDLNKSLNPGMLAKIVNFFKGGNPADRSNLLANQLAQFKAQGTRLLNQIAKQGKSQPDQPLSSFADEWKTLAGVLNKSLTPQTKGIRGTPYLKQSQVIQEVGASTFNKVMAFFESIPADISQAGQQAEAAVGQATQQSNNSQQPQQGGTQQPQTSAANEQQPAGNVAPAQQAAQRAVQMGAALKNYANVGNYTQQQRQIIAQAAEILQATSENKQFLSKDEIKIVVESFGIIKHSTKQ